MMTRWCCLGMLGLLLGGHPLQAQGVPGGNFQAWFSAQVAGKPFSQQTLIDLIPALIAVGSQLTPPNAVGEKTKIWDPTINQWVRVGFGEGHWVWIPQGPSDPPPPIVPPVQPPPTPPPIIPPTVDLYPLHQEINAMHALMVQMLNRNEELARSERDLLAALSAEIKVHDEKPGAMERVLGRRDVQIILGVLGTYFTTHQLEK